MAIAALAAPVRAEETPEQATAAPWQEVITSQIQAFRNHDAPAAFSYAGIGFQASFPNAETFFVAIIQSGYAPIMESLSHKFAEFERVGESAVVQRVKFVGNDQQLYDAVFQLSEEPGGWRVQGVLLMEPNGVAV
jgi:hypothetical protein